MKSMTLRNRGIMVSLSALALLASLALPVQVASWLSDDASAQPPQPGAAHWPIARTGAHAWPPTGNRAADNAAAPVPRGDLRGDIVNNARRSPPTRPEAPRARHEMGH
ncbi:hypothetical protein B0G62_12757 [Paraburkholderia eburnea]|uniref:Uncharacterized protein n=1 Tax=Paraburkholderia eburnea TaxID=1189126 RepID=A0A2S4LUL0_9BURK|nr:hypothetical protein [Paraburkholderia eburnea]POR46075.1 hypothetical protein B0G62_12757 [Paraburkholderia eburnea]PRZ15721.1 hypothetical protein BX588_12513 [Paraburkholderia eburnea]